MRNMKHTKKLTPVPERTLAAIEHVAHAYTADRISRDDAQLALELIYDLEDVIGSNVTIEQITETFNGLANLLNNRLARIEARMSIRFIRLLDRVACKLKKPIDR